MDRKEYKRLYYQEHKAKIAEQVRRYQREHKAEITESNHRYQQEHRAEIATRRKRYYQEHKAEMAEYKRLHHLSKLKSICLHCSKPLRSRLRDFRHYCDQICYRLQFHNVYNPSISLCRQGEDL